MGQEITAKSSLLDAEKVAAILAEKPVANLSESMDSKGAVTDLVDERLPEMRKWVKKNFSLNNIKGVILDSIDNLPDMNLGIDTLFEVPSSNRPSTLLDDPALRG